MKIFVSSLILMFFLSFGAIAKDQPTGQKGVFQLHGRYWLHYNHVSAFDLDELGTRDGLGWYLDHRLRISPQLYPVKNLKIIGEFDAMTGQIAGDTTMVGAGFLPQPRSANRGYKQAAFRQAYVAWKSPVGLIALGQMTSDWGLGILANAGKDRTGRFYDPRFGDLVDRVMFATTPAAAFTKSEWAKHLYLALGFDVVYRDENANLREGDRALEGIFALFYKTKIQELGVYAAYRNQRYENGDSLKATAMDLYGNRVFDFGWSKLRLDLEGTMIFGSTDHVVFLRSPRDVSILSFGFVQRSTWDIKKANLTTVLELGFASGDSDPTDSTIRGFSFDPDYHVGMILFPEVVARSSARAADRVADPNLVQTPPKGYDMSATNGAITNAFYVAPSVTWHGYKGLSMTFLVLIATAPAPVYSPYNSAQNGGYPTSYRGSTGRFLGTEVDYGLTWEVPLSKYLNVALGGDLGLLVPGSAFNDAFGGVLGNVYKARARLDLVF